MTKATIKLNRPVYFLGLSAIMLAIVTAWRRLSRLQVSVDLVMAILYASAFFPFTLAELRYYWQRAQQFGRKVRGKGGAS